ncbi:hypothetical protein OY671_008232, partial [Metschnikowia pulcherrima]
MGRRATRVAEADASSYVFGYSVMSDMSARDCRRAGQWIYSKGQDTYAPFGPCIVTADEIPDPQVSDSWSTVNGEKKQGSNTRHMSFKVPFSISDISAGITSEPGDIIATGTPEGVGAGRKPQEWSWPGDVVVACVEGIGTSRHPTAGAAVSKGKTMIKQTMLAARSAWTSGGIAHAAEPVKIGFIATSSTPAGYIGEDERDAFMSAVKEGGGKLGGVPVNVRVEDDALKPANAKQIADKMVQGGVRSFTGVNFSNVMAAVGPTVLNAGGFYVSSNAGPSN